MKTILQWILGILEMLRFVKRSTDGDKELNERLNPTMPPYNSFNDPFIANAVERERRQMILRKLREFFRTKPRSWLSPNARAQAIRRQRRNAERELQKRLHSRKGIA